MAETVKITGVLKSDGFNVERGVELSVDLSLRDLFAAFALAGVLASPAGMGEDAAGDPQKAAEWGYEYADAMLAARGLETTKDE